MDNRPLDSRASAPHPRQAPPVGRALRLLLGVVLLAYVVPVYFRMNVSTAGRVLLLLLGLVGLYSLLQIGVSRRVVRPGVGAVVGTGLLFALFVAGGTGAPLLGRGVGQLAALTFLGLSLVVAGVRADPGCEVMAIPGLLFGQHAELACLIFSPLDRLERKLRSKRVV
jgi:hypothetical protein